jgi:outer membrane receptor protein involved in Fe transport
MEIPNVVTATLTEQKANEAPAAITVITGEEILARGYRTIKDVLIDMPGWVDLSDANENIVGGRGAYASTTNKILVLINGHRMNDFNLGRWNLDFFMAMDIVKRIEIIRGPGSVLYGSGALIGVVNIITKTGEDISGVSVRGKATRYQSDTNGYEANVTWGKTSDDLDVVAHFSYIDDDGDHIPQPASKNPAPAGSTPRDGVLYYDKYPRNWNAFAAVQSGNATINAAVRHFARMAPRAVNSSLLDYDSEPLKHVYNWDEFYIDGKYLIDINDKSKVTVNPGFSFYDVHEYSHTTGTGYDAYYQPPYGTVSGQLSKYQHFQLKAVYENQLRENVNLVFGEDLFYSDFYDISGIYGNDGSEWQITRADKGKWVIWGVYGQAIWSPIQQLELTAGGRFDDFADFADSRFTPRLSAVYKFSHHWSNKLLYGESYLSPQWAHKKVVTSGGLYNPDPDMKPEVFKGFDYILEYGGERASASLSLFSDKIDGLISATPVYSYTNLGTLRYQGGEAEFKYAVVRALEINGSFSYVESRDGTYSSYLIEGDIKNMPARVYRAGVTWRPFPVLSVWVWGRQYGAVKTTDNLLSPTTTELESWTTADMSINYRPAKAWDLQLGATNIGDKAYEVGGSVNRPMARPGAAYSFSVGYQF